MILAELAIGSDLAAGHKLHPDNITLDMTKVF
jgi:hypothetical protein